MVFLFITSENTAHPNAKTGKTSARKLGANHYIDSQLQKASEELVKLGGGAIIILATATKCREFVLCV